MADQGRHRSPLGAQIQQPGASEGWGHIRQRRILRDIQDFQAWEWRAFPLARVRGEEARDPSQEVPRQLQDAQATQGNEGPHSVLLQLVATQINLEQAHTSTNTAQCLEAVVARTEELEALRCLHHALNAQAIEAQRRLRRNHLPAAGGTSSASRWTASRRRDKFGVAMDHT